MKYTHFTLNDFVLDDHFIKWVKSPDPQTNAFWESWLETHPDKKKVVEEARQMVLALSVPGKKLSETDKQQLWQQINQRRNKPAVNTYKQPSTVNRHLIIDWLYKGRVAASIAAVLMIAAWWFWLSKSEQVIQYQTQYSEIKNITLPDGSQVTLNANSTLQYDSDWSEQKDREVQLTGEAFFDITKRSGKGNARFIVHTQALNIEVLGTQFNVNNRRDQVQVVLQEGKVSLSPSDNKASSVIMTPGDYVAYSRQNNRMHLKKVNPLLYSSWKEEEMLFEEQPLYEIAQVLEDTKGIKVVFLNDSLKTLSFTGTLPNNDLDNFLMALSKSFQMDVIKKGNQIELRKK